MNKRIKLKERILGALDTSLVIGMVLLYFLIMLFIIAFVDAAFEPGDEIVVSIIMMLIFVVPLIIIFYHLSRILFSIFFQKDEKIDGLIISRKEYPELYNTINEIRAMCKCPKIHVIALDYSNNAHIREGSRFGLTKWRKRYLVIGIPLLLL